MADYISFDEMKIPLKVIFFDIPVEKLNTDSKYYSDKIQNYEMAKESYAAKKDYIDNYPIKLTLQTTEKCNLKCDMCQINRRKYSNKSLRDMETAIIDKIAKEVFPYLIEVHPSNIGESLYSKNFLHLVNLLDEYGVLLDLTTNGVLLNEKMLRKILPITSDIKISLDGAKKETYERIKKGSNYDVIMRNIRDAIKLIKMNEYENKPTVTLQMTLLRSNFHELLDVIRLAKDLEVHRVKAFHLFSFYEYMDDEVVIGSEDEGEFNRVHDAALELAKELDIPIEIAEPNGFDLKYPLLPIRCPLPWTQSWVHVNGRIYSCHSHNGISCRDILKDDFRKIWNSNCYLRIRKGLNENKPVGLCKNCGANIYKVYHHQRVPYDAINFKSSGPYHNVPIRWSGRMKQFDLPEFWGEKYGGNKKEDD